MASVEVRERLEEALQLDLVGPWAGHPLEREILPDSATPSAWYLTGFLIPSGTPPELGADADEDEDLGDEVPDQPELFDDSTEERRSAKRGFFPSSIGLSCLVPEGDCTLAVTARWGEYAPTASTGADGLGYGGWQRTPCEARVLVALKCGSDTTVVALPDSRGLEVHALSRRITGDELVGQLQSGAASVSVFLVNSRATADERSDRETVFQTELHLETESVFLPRPDLRGARSETWDESVDDLHYADTPEYATGHGVSATWEMAADGTCRRIRTTWIGRAEVEKTVTPSIPAAEFSMGALGSLQGGSAVRWALLPLVASYRDWIERQASQATGLPPARRRIAEALLGHARHAAARIEHGITVLCERPDALDAFRVANRAVAAALAKRLHVRDPKWHAFQLAFVLQCLPELVDPKAPTRSMVDLLFFPTGGGKTEAYLGLAAFTMVWRRLCHSGDGGRAGAGTSVIMRYTLRLLTLDQLGRAAGLVCALELERERDPGRYGTWPFEIGLWVGRATTPNHLGAKGDGRSDSARARVVQFKSNPRNRLSPIPLENCPWCDSILEADSFELHPNHDAPTDLRLHCLSLYCEFSGSRPLPIVAVDEPLYRRLPAFLIATVDKFATLPWVGASGLLLGGAARFDDDGFYGPATPKRGHYLTAPLPPPNLVIQDELHLISGPLGTMAGLYETAIEALCLRNAANGLVGPKIVASTATVRQAANQVQALFGRGSTRVFPPPGPNRRDSFFAHTLPATTTPARLYLGVAAPGRNPKVVMMRVWLALMGAAQRAYEECGGSRSPDNPADPYMTVLGYFNALRELGGARRILEEQVQNTLRGYSKRRRVGERAGLFRNREDLSEVLELTSRVPTSKIAEAKRRLGTPFHEPNPVSSAIATNMISVGLDIPRLGLMVVFGQPKTHAEYIQATSRVGRGAGKPGLVVSLLNIHKPRDRSHYERFRHYHETFYRSVEVSSATPFSARALDRGLAGALVALARHLRPELTPPQGAGAIAGARAALEEALLDHFRRRVENQPWGCDDEKEERQRSVRTRIVELLESWQIVAETYQNVGAKVQYQQYEEKSPKPLLRGMLEADFETEHHRKFRVNRSLRDVEPEVDLILKNLGENRVGGQS